jgi:hypothetical protein
MAGHGDDVKVIGLSAEFLGALERVMRSSANGNQSSPGRRAASHRYWLSRPRLRDEHVDGQAEVIVFAFPERPTALGGDGRAGRLIASDKGRPDGSGRRRRFRHDPPGAVIESEDMGAEALDVVPAFVDQAMVVAAQQDQVDELRLAPVDPVHDVVGVQEPAVPAPGLSEADFAHVQ